MEDQNKEGEMFNEFGLTKYKLRTFEGFENVTDDEAENIISTFRKFSLITFKLFRYVKEVNRPEQYRRT